jgi:hypothetical protein
VVRSEGFIAIDPAELGMTRINALTNLKDSEEIAIGINNSHAGLKLYLRAVIQLAPCGNQWRLA